jgi:hypothetical protein
MRIPFLVDMGDSSANVNEYRAGIEQMTSWRTLRGDEHRFMYQMRYCLVSRLPANVVMEVDIT